MRVFLQIVFSQDSESVAVLGYDNFDRPPKIHTRRFDVATGRQLPWPESLSSMASAYSERIALNPDGKQVLRFNGWAAIKVYDRDNGKLLSTELSEDLKSASVFGLVFRPDGKAVAYAEVDWQNRKQAKMYLYSTRTRKARLLSQDGAYKSVFSPDGKYLALVKYGDDAYLTGTILLFDGDGELLPTPSLPNTTIVDFCFKGDTLVAVGGGPDGPGPVLRLWDVPTGKLRSTPPLSPMTVTDDYVVSVCTFSPDGKTLAYTPRGKESRVRLFDTETGKPVATSGHTSSITDLAFSADGKLLASADKSEICIWDLKSGKSIEHWQGARWEGKGNRHHRVARKHVGRARHHRHMARIVRDP